MLNEYFQTANTLGKTRRQKMRIFWLLTKNFRTKLGLTAFRPNRIFKINTCYGKLYLRDNFGDLKSLTTLADNEYGIRHFGGGRIIDVGANIGLISAFAEKLNPESEIYAFEPLPENVELMKKNCPKARVFPIGLGEKPEKVALEVDDWGLMASAISRKYHTRKICFDILPLDMVAEKEKIGKVAWLKIDVEGMELSVLRGAKKTLSKTSRISLETHSPELHEKAKIMLKKAGFLIEKEHSKGGLGIILARNGKAI